MRNVLFILKLSLVSAWAISSLACSLLSWSTKKDELIFVEKTNPLTNQKTAGFMDKTGKIVVGPWESFEWNGKKYETQNYPNKTYFKVYDFFEGMAGICFYSDEITNGYRGYGDIEEKSSPGKCGFIDKTGKIVIEPKYGEIGYFSDGLAIVTDIPGGMIFGKEIKYGYIDKTGKLVIEQRFHTLGNFNDGLAAASEKSKEKPDGGEGYIDKTGNFVIVGNLGTMFDGGYAIRERKIIDKKGKEVATPDVPRLGTHDYSKFRGYVELYSRSGFSEGLAMAFGKDQAFGFVNTKGEYEIEFDPTKVVEIGDFSEGFAPVRPKNVPGEFPGWIYIDRKGLHKVTKYGEFQYARSFSEGLAAVMSSPERSEFRNKWGFINTEFKTAVPFCFESVQDFRAGLAQVKYSRSSTVTKECEQYNSGVGDSDGRFYIDKTGAIVSPQW